MLWHSVSRRSEDRQTNVKRYILLLFRYYLLLFSYIFCFVFFFLLPFLNPTNQLEMSIQHKVEIETVSVQRMQISKKRYLQFYSSTPTPHVTMTHRFRILNEDIQFRARVQILMNDDDNYKRIVV